LDTVQAVVLSAKLKHLDQWNEMRNDRAAYYGDLLRDTEGVRTPTIESDRTHVFQTFAVRVKNRDKICDEMKNKGIGVLIHYPIPLHLQPAYQELGYKKGDFPVAEKASDEVLSLPMFPHMTNEQVEYVASCLIELVRM
jgi:dTDP-4-amino-4,6-dideoxygalactose transaminase